MVTCTITPCRAAVRLNSGVRHSIGTFRTVENHYPKWRHSFETNFVYFVTSSMLLPISVLIIVVALNADKYTKLPFYAASGVALSASAFLATRSTTFANLLCILVGSIFGKIAFGLIHAHRLILKGFSLPSFYVPVIAYLLVFAFCRYRK